jgi:hypothetical protein
MMGGLVDCIPVPYDDYSIDINRPDSVLVPDHFNGKQPAKLSARLDDPKHPWNNSSLSQEQRYFSILGWALDTLLDRTNTNKFYLREITDWAISQRMFQMNLAGTEDLRFTSLSDEKAAMIERVMTYLKESKPGVIFHGYGWMRPEPLVQWISAWGGSFHGTMSFQPTQVSVMPGLLTLIRVRCCLRTSIMCSSYHRKVTPATGLPDSREAHGSLRQEDRYLSDGALTCICLMNFRLWGSTISERLLQGTALSHQSHLWDLHIQMFFLPAIRPMR